MTVACLSYPQLHLDLEDALEDACLSLFGVDSADPGLGGLGFHRAARWWCAPKCNAMQIGNCRPFDCGAAAAEMLVGMFQIRWSGRDSGAIGLVLAAESWVWLNCPLLSHTL